MDDVPVDLNIAGVPQPDRACNFVPAKSGEILKLGPLTIRILEDGSNTDNRISIVEITLPAGISGPPSHWHEMHDEIFIVTQGRMRFHVPASSTAGVAASESSPPAAAGKTIDAGVGETVTVPIRAPHTFSNPFDEECKFLNTFTPAFYVNYLKLVTQMTAGGEKMTPANNTKAMSHFATILADLKK